MMSIYRHPNLQQAFDIYVQRQNALLPDGEELDDVTFSADFEMRMERLFTRRRYGYYVLFGTAARRAASVVVALLVSATLVTVSVEAIRTPVVQFFTRVFETFTQLFVADDTPALPETIAFEPHAPAYIPEGYVVRNRQTSDVYYHIVYFNDDGNQIQYMQKCKETIDIVVDTEKIRYTDIEVGRYKGIAYTNKGKNVIVFTDDKYTYTLTASINPDELIKIAESIKK